MFSFGDDTEIDLQAHEEREFLEYQWMRLEELPEKVKKKEIMIEEMS